MTAIVERIVKNGVSISLSDTLHRSC